MINSVWETHLYSSFYIKINTSCPVGFIPVLVTSLSLPCIHMCSHDNPSLHYVSLRGNLLINFFLSFLCLARHLANSICSGLFQFKVLLFSLLISSLAKTRGPARTDRKHCLFSPDITESGIAESDAFT